MKIKRIIAMLVCACMCLGTFSFVTSADQPPAISITAPSSAAADSAPADNAATDSADSAAATDSTAAPDITPDGTAAADTTPIADPAADPAADVPAIGPFGLTMVSAASPDTYSYSKTFQIQTSNDDCAVNTTTVNFTDTGLYLQGLYTNNVHQDTYLRFNNIVLPADANITNAYLSFNVRDASTKPTTFKVTGQTGNGAAFGSTPAYFNGLSFTSNSVQMTTPNSITAGSTLNTPDLSPIMNEIRTGDPTISSFVFKIAGNDTGSAVMKSYNSAAASAPKLVVEYTSVYGQYLGSSTTGSDTAEQYGTAGAVDLGSTIEMGGYYTATLTAGYRDINGFRFPNVAIPGNAEITDAYMEYTVQTAAKGSSSMVIKAQTGNPATYTTSANNVTNRTYGILSVNWQQGPYTAAGQIVRTPNLEPIIDEQRLNGWQSGQALAFMVDGNGFVGSVYRANTANAPRLVINYKAGSNGIIIPGALSDPAQMKNVYLNEVANSTGSTTGPWVELYNANNVPVILGNGMYLGDDNNPNKYQFSGMLIPAGGFRVLALNSANNSVSANFTLNNTPNLVTVADHLIINQVYGTSDATGAVNYGFAEIYNPNAYPVSMSAYSLQYYQNPTDQAAGWATLPLSGTIPGHGSFLVAATGTLATAPYYSLTGWDQEWQGMTFSNRAGSYALVSGSAPMFGSLTNADRARIVDLVGTINDPTKDTVYYYDGAYVSGITKQASARRKNFADTKNNANDFTAFAYNKGTAATIEANRPHTSAEGSWSDTPVNPGVNHLIINQAYGSGPLDNSGAISNSFVELYNPTNSPISLAGYSLQFQNGVENGSSATKAVPATEWEAYYFTGGQSVAAHSSFLICLAQAAPGARYVIPNADVSWTTGRILSNRAYSIALVKNQNLLTQTITPAEMAGVVDLVGATNDAAGSGDQALNYEGTAFNGMSKQKAIRRTDFQDTNDNASDFTGLDYRSTGISDTVLAQVRPRWSGDGAWGYTPPTPPTPPTPVQAVVSRNLTLTAFYNNSYKAVDQLPYFSMQTGETYGRFNDGDSSVVKFNNNGTYNASNNPAIPVMSYSVSQPSGQYANPFSVTITTDPVNTVKYTTDGTIPGPAAGTTYTGPISITQNTNLRVYIYNSKTNSGVLTYAYVIGSNGLQLKQKTVTFPIKTGNDDLYATASTVNLTDAGTYLSGMNGTTSLTTYLRFAGASLPPDAIITGAYITFTNRTASTASTSFTVTGDISSGTIKSGDPFTTALTSVTGRTFTASSSVTQTPATAAVGSTLNTSDISSVISEMLTRNPNLSNYVFKIDGSKTGAYVAQSYEGSAANCAKLVVSYFSGYDKFVGTGGAASDTAEQYGTAGAVDLGSTIEMGGYYTATLTAGYRDINGFRFPNVVIPPDAEITDAYMEYTVQNAASGSSNMVIKAQTGNPATYTTSANNVTSRTYGSLSVNWQQGPYAAGQIIRTPNLEGLIDEQRLSGWQSGQALAFMVDGNGYVGSVYRANTTNAPRLVVNYRFSGNGAVIPGAITDSSQMKNVYINEVSAEGTDTLQDSWVELYNANDSPVILDKGMYLSKNKTLTAYQFSNFLIPAKGYRIVDCDGLPNLGPGHASFTLSNTGTVYLNAADSKGTVATIDSLTYTAQLYNQTYGRYPDGSSNTALFQSESYGLSNSKSQLNYQVIMDHDRGVYSQGFNLAITCSNPSAKIMYTVNGTSTPSATAGTAYTGPIAISKNTVVKIYAFDAAGNSGLQAYTYILQNNLKNETATVIPNGISYGNTTQWAYKSTINDSDYAAAMACFPIISVTSNSGAQLAANADYVPSTFEFIDSNVYPAGQSHNFFSYAGTKKFGQASMTWYNSSIDLSFHKEYNTKKVKDQFFDPVPNDPYPTPGKYGKLQLKEGEDGPQSDVWNLGYLRYDDVVTHTLGLQMKKFDLKERYVQFFFNGQYRGLKTLREAFNDGSFENYFGDDSTNYTTFNFQDTNFSSGAMDSGSSTVFNAIKQTVSSKNFQEFKKYVDVNDFIKFQILYMFTDTEHEAFGIVSNNAYSGGGQKMLFNINDADGAFWNNGQTGTTGYAYAGGAGTYRYKWGETISRQGPGGWFAAFGGDSTTATAGNLEFKTLVKDQVLAQIGPNSGDMKGAPGAPLSVANVGSLIQQNYLALNNNSAYKVDAAYMSFANNTWQNWVNFQPKVQSQLVDRVSYTLQQWAKYGMAHDLSPVTINAGASGTTLTNPNSGTTAYYTMDGTDPMGANGAVSSAATAYTAGQTIPAGAKLTVRAFKTNDWGPLSRS